MNTLLERAVNAPTAAKEFRSTVALFYPGSSLPYAVRAPLDSPIPSPEAKDAELIYSNNFLRISISENRIYCVFGHTAVITLQNEEDVIRSAKSVESRFKEAAKVLSSRQDLFPICGLIAQTAEFCGCLTDINPPEDMPMSSKPAASNLSSYYAIGAIIAICLIYRRLSALRGFNFKQIFNDGLPCLVFSAKILGEGIERINDLPEYPALEDLESNGGVSIYSRLIKLSAEDGDELYRLTLVLTLGAETPIGILRSPEWRSKMRKSLDGIDLDIPGRF